MGTPIIQTPIHYNPDYSDSAKGALDFQKLSNLSQMNLYPGSSSQLARKFWPGVRRTLIEGAGH